MVTISCGARDLTTDQTTVSTISSTLAASSTSSTTSTVLQSTSTSEPPASTVPTNPLGLLTTTGVPVTILASTPLGYQVLTPCGNEVLLEDGVAFGTTTVVIDPGHGGPVDTGAVASTGVAEKEVNLLVAQAVEQLLWEQGISAVVTRSGDYASPLSVRAQLADSLDAEIMVSIHHNSPSPGPSPIPGVEVFIQANSSSSRRLGGLLWKRAMQALDEFDIVWVAADDAGVMTVLNSRGDDAYGIIRHPQTSTALIELGYISNRAEAELHQHPMYVPVAAGAIAQAISEYLQSDGEGSGFVAGRVFNPEPGVGKDVCTDPDLGR